jgi:hypothetical protein
MCSLENQWSVSKPHPTSHSCFSGAVCPPLPSCRQNELVKCVRHGDLPGVTRVLPLKETDVNARCPVTVWVLPPAGTPTPYEPHTSEVSNPRALGIKVPTIFLHVMLRWACRWVGAGAG